MGLGIVLTAIFIFLARVLDVGMGTIRIIFISRGLRTFAALLGFFEILIWLVAISQIVKNLNSPVHYVAYAAGFATGNYVGISIENRLSVGNLMVRVITHKDAGELVSFLNGKNYRVTSVNAEGATGPVKVLFTVIRRRDVQDVLGIIKKFNPNAFYTVEDVRFVTDINRYSGANRRGVLTRVGYMFSKKK